MDRVEDQTTAGAQPPSGRVVLCNIGRVGDTILRDAILDSVYRTYTEVTYICGKGNFEVVRSDPRHRRVIKFGNNLSAFASILREILRGRLDAYIDLKDHDSSVSLILARLFRAREKTGVNRPGNRPFQHDTAGSWVKGRHRMESMKDIARAAGLRLGDFRPHLALDPASVSWFSGNCGASGPFILLNVSATHPSRVWAAEKWIAYLKGAPLPEWPILVNGVPSDRVLVEQICSAVPRARAIAPRHFMDVAAAVAAARLVVTVNTGVMHACSALNTPIIVVANGPAEIREFAPLSDWRLVVEAVAPKKIADLDAEVAIEATRRQLATQPLPEPAA